MYFPNSKSLSTDTTDKLVRKSFPNANVNQEKFTAHATNVALKHQSSNVIFSVEFSLSKYHFPVHASRAPWIIYRPISETNPIYSLWKTRGTPNFTCQLATVQLIDGVTSAIASNLLKIWSAGIRIPIIRITIMKTEKRSGKITVHDSCNFFEFRVRRRSWHFPICY